MVENEPNGRTPETEPSAQELLEDRYYQQTARGLAEVIKSGVADEPKLREQFEKLIGSLNWAIGVGEDPSYRPRVQAVIGYLGPELFGDDPRAFVDNPRYKRTKQDIIPLSPRGSTDYDFDRFKSNRTRT